MSDGQSGSVASLHDRNRLLKDEHEDIEYAEGELHYTGFDSHESFRDLTERHGLKLTAEFPGNHFQWAWVAPDGLTLRTSKAPFNGESGYLSYTFVRGPAGAAESLYRDIIDSSQYIKGEFQELTTDSGEPIVSYWDLQHDSSSDEQQTSGIAPDGSSPFWDEFWDDIAQPKPRYQIVAKAGDDEWVPLEELDADSPRELADDVLWRHQEVSP